MPKQKSKEVVQQVQKLEEIEYGLKELITGFFIGIVVGFILAVILL